MENLTIAGRVGQDATIKEFNGNQYTAFSIAVDNSYKKADGTKVEKTNWYNCLKSGTGLAPYIRKGQFLVVSGRPQPKMYRDQSGQSQISLNMVVEHVTLGPSPSTPTNQSQEPVGSTHPSMLPPKAETAKVDLSDAEDDLPF